MSSSAAVKSVADRVTRRAQRQGWVARREVRAELAAAGLDESLWREVIVQTGLLRRQSRYYWESPAAARLRQERARQETVRRAVRKLVRGQRRAARQVERRGEDRFDFLRPVRVHTDDGRVCHVLSRDLSLTGIRLIGTHRLLGQKVRVEIRPEGDAPGGQFTVRILWTCAVADGLFENGGNFLEAVPEAMPEEVEAGE
jgi:hypothetical protein